MSEKMWAEIGKWLVSVIIAYAVAWLLVAGINAAFSLPDKSVQKAYIECRVTFTAKFLWPRITTVEGKPMEFCEQWAKEHP